MPASESPAPMSTSIPVIRKSDRVDAPSTYASWRDYAFSDETEQPPPARD